MTTQNWAVHGGVHLRTSASWAGERELFYESPQALPEWRDNTMTAERAWPLIKKEIG